VARLASLRPSGGPGRVGWPGERVELGTRQRLLGGGCRNSGSGEQTGRPSQHAGVQARKVWGEALGVLRWPRARAEQGAHRRRHWWPQRGSVSRASRGEEGAFIAGHKWRQCATDWLLHGTAWAQAGVRRRRAAAGRPMAVLGRCGVASAHAPRGSA
jgi:hypothetical protein